MSLLTAYHLHIIHVQHPRRALPYAMGTSGGPASLPYYFAAFLTIDSTKTTPRNASPVVYFEVQHCCWSCNSRSSPAMPIRISPRSGGYRRITPFPFSLSPRRRLEYGSAKHVSTPGPSRRRVRRTNPAPSSHVTATRAGRRRTLGDGNPSGNRETRRPPAATPAPPPATTGVRMTGGGACVVWRACGRPCAARGRRCSSGPSSDASAGTAVRTRSRWTGTTCCA